MQRKSFSQPTKFASVSIASSGSNTLVAAVTGKKIHVVSAVFVAANTVTLKLQSGTGGTDLTGAMTLIAGVPLVLGESDRGWLETASGDLLNALLGGAVQVSGLLTYLEI